jgi:VWFA-related protein
MRLHHPRHGILPLLAATVALLLAPTAPAAGQQEAPTPPPFSEELEVTEVLLDVLVTDRDGNVIVGLGKDDFLVEEEGRPVPLIDVTFYSNRPRLDESGRAANAAESERFFILFIHDQRRLNTEVPGVLARQLEAARRVRNWVGKLQLDDYVAVVSYDTSLEVHQDFTRDRGALLTGIDEAVQGSSAEGNWASRLPPEGEPSLLRGLPRGRALLDATDTIYEALSEVAEAAAPLVGRKNLLLLSTGFGQVNSFGQFSPEERYQEPMERALNDANVAVYAVDLAPASLELPFANALSLLAKQTGGRYFQNVINFDTPLAQIAEETSGYYLISYRAQRPRGASGFQPVRVTVANPEFRLKARAGYAYGD